MSAVQPGGAPVLAVFDTETTGIDVDSDRIVTAFVGGLDAHGVLVRERRFLINPGIPIPAEATAIHGITDELAATGMQPAAAIRELTMMLKAVETVHTIVSHNASYDWSILRAEHERHLGAPLDWEPRAVADTFILDKRYAKFRRGKRTLETIAPLYGVQFDGDAHNAAADAVAAGRVYQSMQQRVPGLARMSPAQLMQAQRDAAAEQRASLRGYFLREKGPEAAAGVRDGWPFYDRA